MQSVRYLVGLIGYQALRVLNPREGYCLLYLAGGLVFALGVMLWRRRKRKGLRARSFLRLLGSRELWTHHSTLLDLQLYLLHGVLILIGYGLFEGSSEAWQAGASGALTALFGQSPTLATPHWIVGGATTLLQVLALEFGYWALHYAFHKVPVMWELHKVHHSAEVMTPLTEWRQHPIEFIAFANVLTLSTGSVFGVMAWLFGKGAEPFTLFQINALLVLHLLTFHHLRHSGVWVAATGWLGRLVHSPAHHQIHHSTDPRHFDSNLGYATSIFDWAFGTLVIPALRQKVSFGVAGEAPYASVADTLVRPLAAGASLLGRRRPPGRALAVEGGGVVQRQG